MEQKINSGPGLQKLGNTDPQQTDLLCDPYSAWEERRDSASPMVNARILSFPQITALILDELPSEASRRVYRNTFQQWEQFADNNGLNVLDLFSDNIKSFLYSRHLSYSTRLSRKSHMQKLLRVAAHVDPSFGIYYFQLRDLKIEGASEDNAPRGEWDAQTLMISPDEREQGCGVPIFDASLDTINALRRLQLTQRSVSADQGIPFSFMFPALSAGKYARFTPGKDVRTSTQTIRNIVKQSAEITGLGKLSCLDLRHTSLNPLSKSEIFRADIASSADG